MIDDRQGISHATLSHWITRKPSTGKHMSMGVEYKPLYKPHSIIHALLLSGLNFLYKIYPHRFKKEMED